MRKAWIWILVLTVLLASGCQSRLPETPAPPAETQTPTEPPTESPVEEPTEPKPEHLLHSGLREDGTFDAGTLFIGDSLTYGLTSEYLIPQNLLGQARYMAMAGAAPTAFVHGPRLAPNSQYYSFYSEEFEGLLMSEAVTAAGETVTAVYFMMGTNYTSGVNVQLYVDIINHILQACPNATVYLQRVPYATSNQVDPKAANERIETAYAQFVQQGQLRVRLIDTQAAIDYNLTVDGIHLTEEGQAAWYQALVDYARENEIPQ